MTQIKFHCEIHKWILVSADLYKDRLFARILTVRDIHYSLFLLLYGFITSVFKKPYFDFAWKNHLQDHGLFISVLIKRNLH